MKKEKTNTSGKFGVRPKSYRVSLSNFGQPGTQEFNYHHFVEAKKHLAYLLTLSNRLVPGESLMSKALPMVRCSEVLRSRRLDKQISPTKRFVAPEDVAVSSVKLNVSYLVWVHYKVSWPTTEWIEYHYHSLKEAEKHLHFLCAQVVGQNGKNGIRTNVVLGFQLFLCKKFRKTSSVSPPIVRFVSPKGRTLPEGGRLVLSWQ